MTAGTVRTARRPRTWVGSGWAGTARPTTEWSPSPRCGPASGSATRCTPCPAPPAKHFAKGKNDPAFRTKLAIGADLAVQAREAGFAFRAVVADCAYGDQDGFRARAGRGRAAVRHGAAAAPRDLGPR